MSFYFRGIGVPHRDQPRSRIRRHGTFQKQSKARVHSHVGAWVATPGYLREEIERLNVDVMTTEADIVASWKQAHQEWLASLIGTGQLKTLTDIQRDFPEHLEDPARPLFNYWKNVWSPFVNEWQAFRAEKTEGFLGGLTKRLWGATWDSIQDRRRQLIRLREGAKKFETMDFVSPEPQPPPTTPYQDVWSTIKTIAIVGGIAFGAFLGISLLSRARNSTVSAPALPAGESRKERQARQVAERIKEKS